MTIRSFAFMALASASIFVSCSVAQDAKQADTKGRRADSRQLRPPPTINPDTGEVGAQSERVPAGKMPDRNKGDKQDSLQQKEHDMLPVPPPEWMNDPATKQKYLDSLQGYYEYRRLAYMHRQRDFRWQHVSTIVIFIVVLLLVSSGIYFAYVQFHAGLKAKAQNPAAPEEKSDIEISMKGLRVSSSVLGVIILGISLAFFYLYLVYVYPISDSF
jgi:hypothetical protein